MSTVSYKEAMQQLQSMFPDFDRETLKTVLVANDGHFEKTIEDCLKMASDNEAGHGGHNDNLFSNAGGHRGGNQPKKMYDASEDLFGDENEPQAENAFENLGMFKNNNANNQQAIDDDDDDFGDNEYKSQQMARKIQESEDAKLAYALQQEYLRREQEAQRQARYSQPTNYTVAHFDGMYRGNPTVNYRPEEQKYNQNVPMSNNTAALPGEKKKKKGLGSKIKGAFSSLFGKKGKKKNAPTNNPGEYVEISAPEEEYNAYSNLNDQREALQFDQLDGSNPSDEEGANDRPSKHKVLVEQLF